MADSRPQLDTLVILFEVFLGDLPSGIGAGIKWGISASHLCREIAIV